jgi:hypothetical protein
MYATNYFENQFLNTLRDISFTAPEKVFIGLFLSNPTDTGTAGTEIAYEGYERREVTFTAPAPESGGIGFKNSGQIRFAETNMNVGTITHIGIFDSKIGGNMLLYGKLNESLPLEAGEAPVLLEGEIVYYLTGSLTDAYKTKLLNVLRKQNLEGFNPHLSLWNGDPEVAGSELSGDNYSRIPLTFTAPTETPTGQSSIENAIDTSFSRPTSSWGTLTHIVIMNNKTSGVPVCKQIRGAKEVKKGFMPIIKSNSIKVMIN